MNAKTQLGAPVHRYVAVMIPVVLLLLATAAPSFGLDRDLDDWVTQLRVGDPAERAAAAEALAEAASHDVRPLVPVLADALRDPVAEVRLRAAEAFLAAAWGSDENGAQLNRVTPRLIERLDDVSAAVRVAAANALAVHQPHTPRQAVPALLARLGDADHEVRQAALGALGHLQEPDEAVLQALLVAQREDPNREVRADAMRALGDLGADDPAVVEALIATLSDPDPYVRRQAVRALGKLGPAAFPAVDELERIAEDPQADDEIRRHAASALRSIGVPAADEVPGPGELRGDRNGGRGAG